MQEETIQIGTTQYWLWRQMMAEQINEHPFSINVDEYGNAKIDPPIAGGYRCWREYKNGMWYWCCYTHQGKKCFAAIMDIVREAPEDPGPPSEDC